MVQRFRTLLNFSGFIPGDGSADSDNILVVKGDQLHEVILYVVLIYASFFTVENYIVGNTRDAFYSAMAIPLTLFAYLLLRMGWSLVSKTWNLIQVIGVVSLLSLNSTQETGVLTYYFPSLICIQLVFQGRQRFYGYYLSAIVLVLLLFLITTDYKLSDANSYSDAELQREQLWNYGGAAIATFLALLFILRLSDNIRQRLINTTLEISNKNKELLKANTELDNFVYRVSHDLRSPLLAVKGLLSLTSKLPEMPERSVDYLGKADRSINRLDETIREILEYSRNSRLQVKQESFNIRRTVEAIFEDLHYVAPEHFRFTVKVEGDEEVHSDGYRWNTVLRNVISNSVKYQTRGASDPYVEIRIRNLMDRLEVIAIDNGEGISEEHHSKVFDMFYRATNSNTGTGLGLYICREILTKLGGTISLESKPGQGTTIAMSLPKNHTKQS